LVVVVAAAAAADRYLQAFGRFVQMEGSDDGAGMRALTPILGEDLEWAISLRNRHVANMIAERVCWGRTGT
jgi:hypothetical protein